MNKSRRCSTLYSDSWIKADGASFDDVNEAKKILGIFEQRGFNPIWKSVKEGKLLPGAVIHKPPYIDTLSTTYHGVYVCKRKKFGFLYGSNGKGKALVTWETDQTVCAFDAAEVISM